MKTITDAPETLMAWGAFEKDGKILELLKHAIRMERERDEARDALSEISLYLSVGMGNESTTTQQYYERIIEGIGMLTRPIMHRLDQVRIEREEAREQRDRLLEEREQWRLSSVCRELTKQRDRLAEALERLERTAGLPALQDDPARVQARQALESLTTNKQEHYS